MGHLALCPVCDAMHHALLLLLPLCRVSELKQRVLQCLNEIKRPRAPHAWSGRSQRTSPNLHICVV